MSSEKKGGKKKRWFEQFYPKGAENIPVGAVGHVKLPVMVKRLQSKHTKGCKCQVPAKPKA